MVCCAVFHDYVRFTLISQILFSKRGECWGSRVRGRGRGGTRWDNGGSILQGRSEGSFTRGGEPWVFLIRTSRGNNQCRGGRGGTANNGRLRESSLKFRGRR